MPKTALKLSPGFPKTIYRVFTIIFWMGDQVLHGSEYRFGTVRRALAASKKGLQWCSRTIL